MDRADAAASGLTGPLLDVGGGTGAHAGRWVGEGRLPIVVDPSPRMCAAAADVPEIAVVAARSQEMPFRDACAGLVYFHLSIHYGSWRRALDEAVRVVREDGRIEIWSFAPETMRSSALARWFPSIGAIDAERFPPVEAIVGHLERLGTQTDVAEMPEQVARTAASWEAAVRNRFVSTLQLLTEDEIAEGLARFKAAYPDPDATYRYTIDFVRIRATR